MRSLPEPKLALCGAAGKDYVCKLLYLLPQGHIGRFADSRSPVRFTSGDGNQYVLLRPSAFLVELLQFIERYLELLRPPLKRSSWVRELWIEPLTKSNEVVFVAAEGIIVRLESQPREKTLQLYQVIRVLGVTSRWRLTHLPLTVPIPSRISMFGKISSQPRRRPCRFASQTRS